MTGPGASHPGPCDHHKSRGALGDTVEKHKVSLLINTGASISVVSFLDPVPPRKLLFGAYQANP
jgi:hypothetical protein